MNAMPAIPPLPTFRPGLKRAKTVLVVDDFAPICDLVARHLAAIGYQVLTANRTEDAQQIIRSRPIGEIDLLLTDADLKEPEGGELAAWFSTERPNAPVVLMSSAQQHRAAAGEMALLQKPFTLSALSATVREALGLSVESIENSHQN